MLSDLQQQIEGELFRIHKYCISHRQTIAVAESVTSGCLQLLLSSAPSALLFFQGGITVYNCAQKSIHLNVEPIFAESCQGVDPDIAVTMARNVCALFRSHIGVGVTGYATGMPEAGISKLHAFAAIVHNGITIFSDIICPEAEGADAQWEYATRIVKRLADVLEAL